MPPENEAADATKSSKKSGSLKSLIVIGIILLMEGGLFAVWKIYGQPEDASAAVSNGEDDAKAPVAETVILEDGRAPNRSTNRLWMYDIQITVETEEGVTESVKEMRGKHEGRIRDGVRRIIAASEHDDFYEPDLQTLKRKLRVLLEEIFGENTIKEVYIPKCNGYRVE